MYLFNLIVLTLHIITLNHEKSMATCTEIIATHVHFSPDIKTASTQQDCEAKYFDFLRDRGCGMDFHTCALTQSYSDRHFIQSIFFEASVYIFIIKGVYFRSLFDVNKIRRFFPPYGERALL